MLYIYMISIDSNESNKLINNIHTLEEMRQKARLTEYRAGAVINFKGSNCTRENT
jgi:hypothetical protein